MCLANTRRLRNPGSRWEPAAASMHGHVFLLATSQPPSARSSVYTRGTLLLTSVEGPHWFEKVTLTRAAATRHSRRLLQIMLTVTRTFFKRALAHHNVLHLGLEQDIMWAVE